MLCDIESKKYTIISFLTIDWHIIRETYEASRSSLILCSEFLPEVLQHHTIRKQVIFKQKFRVTNVFKSANFLEWIRFGYWRQSVNRDSMQNTSASPTLTWSHWDRNLMSANYLPVIDCSRFARTAVSCQFLPSARIYHHHHYSMLFLVLTALLFSACLPLNIWSI